MPKTTPAQATAKWVQRIGVAGDAMTAGVNAVTTAPGQLAAAQSQAWISKLQASQAKWKSRVASVSLQSWQQSMINIGIPRVAAGAQAKQGKYTAFANQFFPFLDTVTASTKAMPKVTLQDSIARVTNQITKTAQFQRSSTPGS